MSTGSRSVYGGSYGCGFPEKLKIVKPIEGSTTLHNWSRLATPDFGSVLQDRPGVATRETEHTSTVEYSRDLLGKSAFFLGDGISYSLLSTFGRFQAHGANLSSLAAEMYSLLDVEEDEVDEMEYLACKSFDAAAPVYTLTTSTVLHPNDRTRTTSSWVPLEFPLKIDDCSGRVIEISEPTGIGYLFSFTSTNKGGTRRFSGLNLIVGLVSICT